MSHPVDTAKLFWPVLSGFSTLKPFSTWRICSREQAKSECVWLVMSSVFVANNQVAFFSLFARDKFAKWYNPALLYHNFIYNRYKRRLF